MLQVDWTTEAWRNENAKMEWRECNGRAMIICFPSGRRASLYPLVTSSLLNGTMTALSVADTSLVFTLVYASRSITTEAVVPGRSPKRPDCAHRPFIKCPLCPFTTIIFWTFLFTGW